MAHPTVNPKRTVIDGSSVIDASILGPKLGTNSVGLTQTPTVLQRHVTVSSLGVTPSTGKKVVVFRAPPSGAVITHLAVCAGTIQNHAVNEADTWTYRVTNKTTGTKLNVNGASLSNTTLAATQFKVIPIDNGAATLLSGEILDISMGISGSPSKMDAPCIVIQWTPLNNA